MNEAVYTYAADGVIYSMTEKEVQEYRKEYLKNYLKSYPDCTKEEKKELRAWFKSGGDPYENPWYLSRGDGCPMDYIEAMRFNQEMA